MALGALGLLMWLDRDSWWPDRCGRHVKRPSTALLEPVTAGTPSQEQGRSRWAGPSRSSRADAGARWTGSGESDQHCGWQRAPAADDAWFVLSREDNAVRGNDTTVRSRRWWLTPRQMAEVSLDLYLRGLVGADEYRLMAYQPELDPAFACTIGALTGRSAKPDHPRDFAREWRARLAFEACHGLADPPRLRQTRAVVAVLEHLQADVTTTEQRAAAACDQRVAAAQAR